MYTIFKRISALGVFVFLFLDSAVFLSSGTLKSPEKYYLTPPAQVRIEKKISEDEPYKNENDSSEIISVIEEENQKVAYLTFDDGPSFNVTPQILDILHKYNIKATFFVLGCLAEIRPELIRRIHQEGHLIANHTYSHNYRHIYSDVNNLVLEVQQTQRILEEILGQDLPKIMRFPSGAFDSKYEPYRQALEKEGYTYFSWNVLNGDGEGKKYSKQGLVNRVKESNLEYKKAIVLMHDSNTKQTTVEALSTIIEYFIEEGYIFATLDNFEAK